MYKIGIMGATGFTGSELVKILVDHPEVELVYLGSNSKAGKKIQDVAPELKGVIDQELETYDVLGQKELDLLFLALPHGVSMDAVNKIWQQNSCKIIDLSADFRFREQAVYEKYYKQHTVPALLQEAVYGLPELGSREMISQTRILANPGCYVTSATLALSPIIDSGEVVEGSVIIDAKSGYSGAGRAFAEDYSQFKEQDRFNAYKVAAHRHQPEIEQNIRQKALFVPHLLPVFRGILSTIYLDLKANSTLNADQIKRLYLEKYQDEPFVEVVDDPPNISMVNCTNKCLIWLKYLPENNKLILISVIDNLQKGASGQAVQNMNLMLGISETTGLKLKGER